MTNKKDYFEKALYYQKKYNLKKKGNWGVDDETDAFRHAFASTDLNVKAGATVSALAGYINEVVDIILDSDNPKARSMDLHNNKVGRKIAEEIFSEGKNKKNPKESLDDIIAEKIFKKMKNNELITDTGKSVQSYYPKKGELTGEMIKNTLTAQKQKLSDFKDKIIGQDSLVKKFHGEVPEGYVNKEIKTNKIFTKEEIDAMKPFERKKLQRAISYQSKVMGIPTEEQAKKAASSDSSGMVFVKGYTRADGVEVKSYYRTR